MFCGFKRDIAMSDKTKEIAAGQTEEVVSRSAGPSETTSSSASAPGASAVTSDSETAATAGPSGLDTAAGLTPSQIAELKAKAVKADEHWDRLVRQAADFDNFKKRAARERQEAVKFANAALIEKLIPVLDSFDMALAAANNSQDPAVNALKEGIAMVFSQFRAVLAEVGLAEIDAANQPFDPNWHEAVAQQEQDDVAEGIVIRQLRKGYALRDRLIRPASVIVAKKPAA
jgi:molecular chaperone GrpE